MRVVHDKKANLETYRRYLEEAADKDARLLVFPECSLQGYTWTMDKDKFVHDNEQVKYFQENVETIPGPSTELLIRKAKKHNMYIQFGMAEKVTLPSGKFYNTVVLVGPEGLVGIYRKVHMLPNAIFEKGDRFVVFPTSLAKIGPLICMDLQFDEPARCVAIDGAELITFSTAWGMNSDDPKTDHQAYMYELLTKTIPLMNQVWLVASAQTGRAPPSKQNCYGHGRIVDPMGHIVADTGYEEGLVVATVDLKREIKRSRNPEFARVDLLQYRYPEMYHAITRPFSRTP